MAQWPPMAGRSFSVRAEPGATLPAFERLAPHAPAEVLAARIEGHTLPGDVVVDLHGRGGWVARAAVDHQRRALTIESNPLTRLLADVVLRPPDLRHLDAAFGAISAAPRGETSLRLAIGDLFRTRCATCGRALALDDLIWETPADEPDTEPRPIRRLYRCTICRDQQGGSEQRSGAPTDDDQQRARASAAEIGAEHARRIVTDRFPVVDGGEQLVDQLLDLHTPRQLLGLVWILERIDADLRAAPVEAALRLALLHALLPASRLNTYPGRVAVLRIQNGRVKAPSGGQWRERNPWLCFEDGYRLVRAFVQRLESGSSGPVQARYGDDLRALVDGPSTVAVRLGTPSSLRSLASEAGDLVQTGDRARIRLVLGQPPLRPTQERLSFAYYATGWTLGREATSLLPIEPLFGSSARLPWGWQSASIRRSLEAVEPLLARDGRVILLAEGGVDGLVATALGGAAAGFRMAAARLADAGEEPAGAVELLPPGAPIPPGPRTRANVSLPHLPGHRGDPETAPSPGLFAPPERLDRRPFSAAEASRQVTDTAVEVLKARGEPARIEQLFGEVVVGLDRAGLLHRLVGTQPSADAADRPTNESGQGDHADEPDSGAPWLPREGTSLRERGRPRDPSRPGDEWALPKDEPTRRGAAGDSHEAARERPAREPERQASGLVADAADLQAWRSLPASADPVERLVALIRDELTRPSQPRLTEVAPGRWWLADRADREAAATPLADRVEWGVYSLLSTAGPLSEAAFYERIASLFTGHDLPDETLVRTCLDSYRSMASTTDRLLTTDDLLRRSSDHSELIAVLAETGHRLGLSVWIGRREQSRRYRSRALGDLLDRHEAKAYLPSLVNGPTDDVAEIDVIWYVRGKLAFLFEVEWTAMLGETVLRRHARIPGDEHLVRFLVTAPERTELIRYKLDRSPLLRQALDDQNWHILKSNHLRAFAALEESSLDGMEPYLGLDPVVERTGDQLPLFGV